MINITGIICVTELPKKPVIRKQMPYKWLGKISAKEQLYWENRILRGVLIKTWEEEDRYIQKEMVKMENLYDLFLEDLKIETFDLVGLPSMNGRIYPMDSLHKDEYQVMKNELLEGQYERLKTGRIV